MKSRFIVCAVLAALCLSVSLAAQSFTGKVVGVIDGDTITIARQECRAYLPLAKIRLYGIDCPESHQAYGTQAKNMTSALAFDQFVSVEVIDVDRYKRIVGVVTLPGNVNLNQALVGCGMAWWYRKYAPHSERLPILEKWAQQSKVGLWSQPNPLPPWEFRRSGSKAKGAALTAPATGVATKPSATDTVYVTRTGVKYHKAGCLCLKASTIPMLRKDATTGHTPCSICRP